MGTEPLGWPDVLAYVQASGDLQPGPDAVILHHMCQRYWTEQQAGRDSLVIAPAERAD